MSNLKHLHFTQALDPLHGGGLGSSALSLHRQSLAIGVDSTLCATCRGAPQQVGSRTFEFRRVHPGFCYLAPELKLRAKELVLQADVIHGHGLYVGTNLFLGGEARRQRKPLVYHVHGMFEPWILDRSRWKKRLAHWLFENANFRNVRLWRALTSVEAEQIRNLGLKAPIVVAPNGLDLGDLPMITDRNATIETPLAGELPKDRLRVLFLSRLHPKKGLDLLLKAWADLRSYHREWQLVIAGPDEGGYLAEVQARICGLGIMDSVCLTGPMTGWAKTALLRSADLFVLPSYSEGFSMTILEAMACEVPVLATRACNFPNITQCCAGWECDANKESLLATLKDCLEAGVVERKQRGGNGLKLVRRQYNWRSIVRTLVAACEAYCN